MAELGNTPLIGFAGAPFTLASYLVEGGPSKHHVKTKALMYGAPELWHALCARLAEITDDVPPGADRRGRERGAAVRLLGRRVVRGRLPALRAAALGDRPAVHWPTPGVPRIHFGVDTAALLAGDGRGRCGRRRRGLAYPARPGGTV